MTTPPSFRFSLSTLIVVMILAGPLCWAGYRSPWDVAVAALGIGSYVTICWMGTQDRFWSGNDSTQCAAGGTIAVLFVICLCVAFFGLIRLSSLH